MNLSDYLFESSIILDKGIITDKESLLKAIAKSAVQNPILKNKTSDEIFAKLQEREKLGSTGFGDKIAIPHCTLEGISDFVIGMVVSHSGLDFAALDNKKTHIFVYIIAPADKRNQHIRFLSTISGVLRISKAVNEILAGKNAKVIRESFLRYTSEKVSDEGSNEYNFLQIFIQNEDRFLDILNILSEVTNTQISIIEANNAGQYLNALPLFSSFWNEDQKGFQRIITAAVEKPFTNDVLRKINLIIDSLEAKSGIMVTMQTSVYLSGSLNI